MIFLREHVNGARVDKNTYTSVDGFLRRLLFQADQRKSLRIYGNSPFCMGINRVVNG